MGFRISPQEVKHVARLASLQISDKELELYTKQIQDVLEYVEQLDRVNVDGVEPIYQTLDGTTNVWREDEVGESLSQEEAVSGAKRTVDGYFVTAPALRSPLRGLRPRARPPGLRPCEVGQVVVSRARGSGVPANFSRKIRVRPKRTNIMRF